MSERKKEQKKAGHTPLIENNATDAVAIIVDISRKPPPPQVECADDMVEWFTTIS